MYSYDKDTVHSKTKSLLAVNGINSSKFLYNKYFAVSFPFCLYQGRKI